MAAAVAGQRGRGSARRAALDRNFIDRLGDLDSVFALGIGSALASGSSFEATAASVGATRWFVVTFWRATTALPGHGGRKKLLPPHAGKYGAPRPQTAIFVALALCLVLATIYWIRRRIA